LSGCCEPPFVPRFEVGVFRSRPGVDEHPPPAVRSADLVRSHARPLRIEPEGGQVSENGSKSSKNPSCSGTSVHSLSSGFQSTVSLRGEEPFDILDHHQSGSQFMYRPSHVCPQPGPGVSRQTSTPAGRGHVLAGKAAGEDVDRPVLLEDGLPVDLGDVTEVRNIRPVAGEDAGGVLVGVLLAVLIGRLVLRVPHQLGVEDVHHGQVQGASPGEQAAYPERAGHQAALLSPP
jgi:hypothetical protein